MDGLILGYDLCDDYCQISCYPAGAKEPAALEMTQGSSMISTVICKKRKSEEWLVGESGYRCALMGEGVIVDKLLRLLKKQGTATIEGVCYEGAELLEHFLNKTLEIVFRQCQSRTVDALVFTLPELEPEWIGFLYGWAEKNGLDRQRVSVVSRTEGFLYFSVSQRKDLWAGLCGLFDLNEEGLHYYEMEVQSGRKPQFILAEHQPLEEGFRLDILDSPSGEKLGDTILCSCAQRLMAKKVYSSVYLTGKGMEDCERWAPEFLRWICGRRKVFLEPSLFSKGAAYLAADLLRQERIYPYRILCEGHIQATVSMEVTDRGKRKKLILAEAGSCWYEARSSVTVIPDQKGELELWIEPVREAAARRVAVSLDEMPARPNKTTKLEIVTSFSGEDRMTIRVIDRGFGEFYPATGQIIRQEIHL